MGVVSTFPLIRNEVLVHILECPASLAKYRARNEELLLKKHVPQLLRYTLGK